MIDPLVAALKQRREELGWDPIKLTREFNWSSAALIRFEAGGDPRLSTVRKVAEALGCDLNLVPKNGNPILSPSYLDLIDRLEKHFTEQGGVTLPLQLIKIQEELGEAAEAYVGMTGSNPRKGVTHTAADVAMELADVALTAILAIRYAGHEVEAVLIAQAVKTEQRLDEYDQIPLRGIS